MHAAELQGLIEDEQRDDAEGVEPMVYQLRCSAGDRCDQDEVLDKDADGQYDRYGIYAGCWHEQCWERFGWADFEFDPSYAGESLDEDY